MITSRISRLIPVLAMLAVVLLAGGCADMMTDPAPSRVEGTRLFNEGNYAEAAGAYRNAIRQDPRDYKSHFYLGASYQMMNNHRQAIAEYKAALNVMPVSNAGIEDTAFRAKVLDTLAQCIARSGDRVTDVALLQKQADQSNKPEDFVLLAKVHGYSGDADSALAAFTRAYRLGKRDVYVLKEYGIYLAQMGQNDEAGTYLKQAYALDPSDAQVDAALRRIGIVPGPSLRQAQPSALPNPVAARAPQPEPDLSRIGQGAKPAPANPIDAGPLSGEPMQAPRD